MTPPPPTNGFNWTRDHAIDFAYYNVKIEDDQVTREMAVRAYQELRIEQRLGIGVREEEQQRAV